MKRNILSAAAAICVFSSASATGSVSDLPKVNIAGREFYMYEVKKGDSLYGISNRYGWNIDRMAELNPSLGNKLEKGTKVYYPVDIAVRKSEDESEFTAPEDYPVIRHIVKKGDSVYSIAKMYGVSIDKIYLYNPGSKSILRKGDVITIPQEPEAINEGSSYLYYTVKDGDTLSDISSAFNTSIEQLMRDNKGMSENNFESGDILRISVNSNKDKSIVKEIDETTISRIDTYKAEKHDTWESVAEKTGVDVEELLEANSGTQLKKNAHIAVPVIETTTVEKEVEPFDERENSIDGIRDIYNEVHMLGLNDSISDSSNSVGVAILIEDPMSKRDNEFVRGVFLAVDRLKKSPYEIRLKVLVDNHSASDSLSVTESLLSQLSDFRPDIVVATHERNFPLWLAGYGEENGVEIVNAFDVKNEMYLENPSMIHLMTPSAYFTDEVGEWTSSSLGSYRLVMVGKEDTNDAFAESIKGRRDAASVSSIKIEDLAVMKLEDVGRYLI
ncbi:MAG: LysM peptidoglycan-binding domain-containing protein, partial [Muribaculaceae bacterium]|nr:LysM peptidoglycan-binding domain-containing protein [Muribaculaceae bacterium]